MDELLVWWKFSCLDYVEDIGILSCGIMDIGIKVRHVLFGGFCGNGIYS